MWKLVLAITISLGGSLAYLSPTCHPEKCHHLMPPRLQRDPSELLGAEVLKDACPSILELIQCFKTELQTCASSTLEDLVASDDKNVAALGNVLLGTSNLVTDLCDEDSEIHKGFVENVDCIRRTVMREENEECVKEGRSLYTTYQNDYDTDSNPECFVGAYVLACVSGEVQKECGEVARHTLLEIVKRTKLIQSQVCSPVDILELKTEFKEYLQLEGERQSIFEQAFDLRKRK